ncbi:MAG: NPCBM/NEW2 domain-containing protein, partial [Planctomycetales bacterium]
TFRAGRIALAEEPAPQAVPVAGKPFPARLTGADENWKLQFSMNGRQRETVAGKLAFWGRPADPRSRRMVLLLPDGDRLVGIVERIHGGLIHVDSDVFGSVRVPRDAVQAVLLKAPVDPLRRDRMAQTLLELSGKRDQILLRNEDRLPGDLIGVYRQERVSDEDPITHAARLETDAGEISVDTTQIAAIRFRDVRSRRAAPAGARAIVGFRDGSLITASRFVLTKKEITLRPVTATVRRGETWRTDWVEDLCFLQPLGGEAAYLSDRKPDAYRQIPFLRLDWPRRDDRNVLGLRLRAGGKLYPKGLGVHSAAMLSYVLRKPHRRFDAELAVDDAAGGRGSVTFHVIVGK